MNAEQQIESVQRLKREGMSIRDIGILVNWHDYQVQHVLGLKPSATRPTREDFDKFERANADSGVIGISEFSPASMPIFIPGLK